MLVKKSFNNEYNITTIVIYVILFFAAFNDILRIGSSGWFTFFRMSLPVAILIILCRPAKAKALCYGSSILLILTGFQTFIISKTFFPIMDRPLKDFVFYYLLYFSIFVIFLLVKILMENQGDNFDNYFIPFCTFLCLIYLVLSFFRDDIIEITGINLDNINNYAICIVASIPLIMFKSKLKLYTKAVVIILSLFVLYTGDAKLALLGLLLEIVLSFAVDDKLKISPKVKRVSVLVLGISICVAFLLTNPRFNGYPMRTLVFDTLGHIFTGTKYDAWDSSMTFRTNATIFAFETLKKTFFLGIGPGGINKLLWYERGCNPDTPRGTALHNSWLEFLTDFGLVAIVLYIIIMLVVLKLFFNKKKLTQTEKAICVFFISFPLWSISAAGIYTIYFLFMMMAYYLYSYKGKIKYL